MFKQLASLFLAAISVTSGLGPVVTVSASSDTYETPAIETSYVLDDLQGSTIDGKEFNLIDYPYNSLLGETQLISLAEYGYDEETTANYSLFAYVYNPKKIDFDVESAKTVLNQITFSTGSTSYAKHSLSYVNSSLGEEEGLFYKFKVMLSENDKEDIYKSFGDSESRIYSVSEIELLKSGAYINADAYKVGKQYTYSGSVYEGNLLCATDKTDTLSLKVGHTQYRFKEDNYEVSTYHEHFTQDSLHSVWFSVPKSVTNNGEMTAVHARWRDAILKPQLVTGNDDAIKYTTPLLGQNIGRTVWQPGYFFASDFTHLSAGGSYGPLWGMIHSATDLFDFSSIYAYNLPTLLYGSIFPNAENVFVASAIEELYFIYDSGNSADSADNYIVSSEKISENIKKSAELYGGNLVNGKYSEKIFYNVADEWTDKVLRAEDGYSLTHNVRNEDFWGTLFGTAPDSFTEEYANFETIKLLSDEDFNGYDRQDSLTIGEIENLCDALLVSTADFNDLYLTYSTLKNTHDIYLLRYQVSDYWACEMEEWWMEQNALGAWIPYKVDSNAYMFSEKVNLDFDIIDVEITNDLGSTIIPVVMSPKDIVPDATPPAHTTPDPDDTIPWWVWVLIIVVLVLVALVILCLVPQTAPIAKFILKGLWYIVSAPIRLIVLLIKKGQERKKKKQVEASSLGIPTDTSPPRLQPTSSSSRTSPKEESAAKRKETTTKRKQ